MAISNHISETEMKSFCSGALPARTTILCAEHLEICPECSRLFAGVAGAAHYYQPFRLQLSSEDRLAVELDDLADEDLDFPAELPSQLKDAAFADVIDQDREQKIRWWTRPIPLTAAVAAVVVLIILAWVIYQRHGVTSPSNFQAGATPTATPALNISPGPAAPPVKKEIVSASPQLSPPSPKDRRRNEIRRDGKGLTVALLDRGRWIGLNAAGDPVGLENQPPEIRDEIAMILRGEPIDNSKVLDELATADVNQRGNADGRDELTMLRPVGTLIREDRPVLRWRPMKEATGYVVTLVDDSFNPVAESPTLNHPEWRVDKPLKRDTAYIWQVTAYKNGEMIERYSDRIARFKVISAEKLGEIEAEGQKPQPHLALAVFFAKAGLLDDAESELQRLFSNPQNAKLTEKIYRALLPNRIRAIK